MNKTMRVAVCEKPGRIRIKTVPIPFVGVDKVLVKVSLCGICSSDIAALSGRGYKTFPYSPGHEFCGIVEALGRDVNGLRLGQRVVVNPNLGCGECYYCLSGKPNLCDFLKTRQIKSNGGFADYVALDSRMIYPLPNSLSDESAVFVEPFSCAIHVAGTADVASGERVGIFGAGCMGLLTGLVLSARKCEVVYIEPVAARRKQASKLLNVSAITPEELMNSRIAGKLDVAIDCSGAAAAVSMAVSALRKAGRLVLAGLVTNSAGLEAPLLEVTTKELQVKGAWLNPCAFKKAIRQAVKYKEVLQSFRIKIFGLDDIAEAFRQASSRAADKILIRV